MAESCAALDALEREYAAIASQRPIPAMDFSDMMEAEKEDGDACFHGNEHQMLGSDSEDEGAPMGYEPLMADSDDEDNEAREAVAAPVTNSREPEKMTANDVATIQQAMQQLSLPAPSWGKNF
ncbi:hypothetical protein SPRG_03842 [Saprolegnia parasitica CBS 223.65]|uniref:Uncharacterized protein n=1 Tax=Saprolegnia parasitica (strain CBS 223.65) TaxID=695850 RepID=A0A067CKI9_SAPPC|nr:hypothetical protein SPRG_03842 [Saprolegnia parasitica CBS 223.65]KDO31224.1 hypothetical protein SPRG_03842 [Saprolegnia parasitica CBS 223.65]|eukprot:XP_012197829.1 hypothetical protein SPRG_03842 [Saprolegnia parasitica CBS 223.65]